MRLTGIALVLEVSVIFGLGSHPDKTGLSGTMGGHCLQENDIVERKRFYRKDK
jgi:hypothetical protein